MHGCTESPQLPECLTCVLTVPLANSDCPWISQFEHGALVTLDVIPV